MRNVKYKRLCVTLTLSLLLVGLMGTTALASGTGDVAGAVESTWQTASGQGRLFGSVGLGPLRSRASGRIRQNIRTIPKKRIKGKEAA